MLYDSHTAAPRRSRGIATHSAASAPILLRLERLRIPRMWTLVADDGAAAREAAPIVGRFASALRASAPSPPGHVAHASTSPKVRLPVVWSAFCHAGHTSHTSACRWQSASASSAAQRSGSMFHVKRRAGGQLDIGSVRARLDEAQRTPRLAAPCWRHCLTRPVDPQHTTADGPRRMPSDPRGSGGRTDGALGPREGCPGRSDRPARPRARRPVAVCATAHSAVRPREQRAAHPAPRTRVGT
ncbi:hypothetical protein FHS08_001249 [Microbacterium ulmi]|nr:hypothetical protein [Microbacterium ulmi]